LTAEDAKRNFLMGVGPGTILLEPLRSEIRVNSSLFEGGDVGSTYDPMFSLGDDVVEAVPARVAVLLDELPCQGPSVTQTAVHFHDTHGRAQVITFTAPQRGVSAIDAIAGGLGGCPYAGRATRSLATQNLIWQLHGLGIDTEVNASTSLSHTALHDDAVGSAKSPRTLPALVPAVREQTSS
jgi:hydroxymethylglutaryl-CoA lyase